MKPLTRFSPATIPPLAEKGRSPEAKAAFEQRPVDQWETIARQLQPKIERVRTQMPRQKRVAAPAGLIAPVAGLRSARKALTSAMLVHRPAPRAQPVTVDADRDHLPEALEEALWSAWVPLFHLSQGEKNNFVFFKDNPNERIIDRTQATPPVGYYSVEPLFVAPLGGVSHGFAQINFATFWDRDDGAAVPAVCRRLLTILDIFIPGAFVEAAVGSHQWDEEHSAALVAAPMIGTRYNGDPAAYRLYSIYTAAHENTPSDRSIYLIARNPIEPGFHIRLALSLQKHATYPGNPEGLPLVPDFIIFQVFWLIDTLFAFNEISVHVYLGLLNIAAVVFFECFVERWRQRDDGVTPSPVINVGNPEFPLNRSSWIRNSPFPRKLDARWDARVVRLLPAPDSGGTPPDDDPDGDPPDRDPPDREPRLPRER